MDRSGCISTGACGWPARREPRASLFIKVFSEEGVAAGERGVGEQRGEGLVLHFDERFHSNQIEQGRRDIDGSEEGIAGAAGLYEGRVAPEDRHAQVGLGGPREDGGDIPAVGTGVDELRRVIPTDIVFSEPDRIAGSLRVERSSHLFENGSRMRERWQDQVIGFFEPEPLFAVVFVMHHRIEERFRHERRVPDLFVVGGVPVRRETDADLRGRSEGFQRGGERTGCGQIRCDIVEGARIPVGLIGEFEVRNLAAEVFDVLHEVDEILSVALEAVVNVDRGDAVLVAVIDEGLQPEFFTGRDEGVYRARHPPGDVADGFGPDFFAPEIIIRRRSAGRRRSRIVSWCFGWAEIRRIGRTIAN